YEGTVNQVMGDGIMALFGAPVAHEDHAVRACHAALRMQETVGRYADELRRSQGIDVQIRVGLNSGEVVVRAIDSDLHMDYSAIGQTTHLAARMEQLARPGTALMTKNTLRLAEGYVEVRPLGPVPVKGLADTVEVFEIVRAGVVRSRLQAAAVRGLTPFVGRDGELGRLREVLQLSKEAEEFGAELGDESRLARVYSYLVNYHYLNGQPDLAIDYGERCLRIADATQDLALQALARGYLGLSCHAQGQYRRAELILRQNVEALAPARGTAADQSAISFVTSSGWLAFTLAELGDFHGADACVDQALRVADGAGHVYGQTIARTLAGLVWLRRGHLDRALGLLQSSLDACREKHLDVWRPLPSSLLGLTLALSGRLDEAMPLLRDGVHLSEVLGVNAYLALWTLHWAEGLMVAGEDERAREMARHALDLAGSHK
ncbi:MAG: hypothetical protein HYR50_06760, partial [Candidatus Rokubacteria bacterium]|nr:hypothetical protein [Candidatus Rokubacteria bacterium]